jgi:hypothetical protein
MCCFMCCLFHLNSNTTVFKKKAKTPKSIDLLAFRGFCALNKKHMVEMTGLEPAASCSQSRRATSCATSRYEYVDL